MSNNKGVIIEESLKDKAVLARPASPTASAVGGQGKVKILSTKVESITVG